MTIRKIKRGQQIKRGQLHLFLLGFAGFCALAITAQADDESDHDHDRGATSTRQFPGSVPTAEPESLHTGNPNGRAVIPFGAVHNNVENRDRMLEHRQSVQVPRQGVQEHYSPGIKQIPQGLQQRQSVREHHEFHEHDVHRFNHDELSLWGGGRWNNTCFEGRCGWWWLAGGVWYFYDRPIYPYPLEVSLDTYVEPVEEAPVVQQAPAPVIVPQTQQQVWYFCTSANAYYPYVSSCPSGWQTVPATPPPDNSGSQPSAPPQ